MRIYGPDLAGLRAEAAGGSRRRSSGTDGEGPVPGVIDLKVEAQVLVPQLELVIDPYKVAAYGLTPAGVVDAVTTLVNGAKVGEVHQDQKIVRRGRLGPSRRPPQPARPAAAGDRPARRARARCRWRRVAELRLVNAPNAIRHDKASRCIDVTCNVKRPRPGQRGPGDPATRRAAARREGYRVEFLGEYQARGENQRQLLGRQRPGAAGHRAAAVHRLPLVAADAAGAADAAVRPDRRRGGGAT